MKHYGKTQGWGIDQEPTLVEQYGTAIYFIPLSWIWGVVAGITYMLGWYS